MEGGRRGMGEKVREMREEVRVGVSVGGLTNTTIASCDPYSRIPP